MGVGNYAAGVLNRAVTTEVTKLSQYTTGGLNRAVTDELLPWNWVALGEHNAEAA